MQKLLTLLFFGLITFPTCAQSGLFNQDITYSRQDSLRGSITNERKWWDLLHYGLKVEVDIESKSLRGSNTISYKVLASHSTMQIDLQAPMQIDEVTQNGKVLVVASEGSAHFIQLVEDQEAGAINELTLHFSGTPKEAVMPPWDGGFSWQEDSNGKPFIANSNQGIGSSIWWPCKDHGYDEPDNGIQLEITVPEELTAVGNGRLVKEEKKGDGKKVFTWKVKNPINNYGVNINIGDYVHFSERYQGENGVLDMDYWVLRENLEKAQNQFKDASRTIEAFEYWFGPYPFYDDSYKLVEVPYLGMEHQSSVTYGNSYQNGYNGRNRDGYDWSGTGWGLKWDYIIVHETGHEWFANSITAKDVADLWIHESFTCYSETLFTEYHFGKEAARAYVIGTRRVIANQKRIIGDYHVNKEGSSDMYFKGNNMLHTLRQIVGDDTKWRTLLRGLNEQFYHQTVTSSDVENYLTEKSGIELKPFFDQYLRESSIPTFEYAIAEDMISYRWTGVVPAFDMPLDVTLDGKQIRISPSNQWKKIAGSELEVDENYYIKILAKK